MTYLRIGELCAGYGGLGMGVQAVMGGDVEWVADVDKGANKILANRFPGIPNYGDITKVDWTKVPPVDVLCAGFPCQPISIAGKQAGVNDERWLFGEVVRAARELDPQPRLLVLENVPRLRTLDRGNVMAAVVQGLAEIGYVGRYVLLRAADVGAPHLRERIFFAAEPANLGHEWARRARDWWTGPADSGGRTVDVTGLLPTPRATDGTKGGPNQRGSSGDLMLPSAVIDLLPTPLARDHKTGYDGGEAQPTRVGSPPLNDVVQSLLPTPTATDVKASGASQPRTGSHQADQWGKYAAAIARWETILGRHAPPPTEPNARGNQRLSPRFVEWMMGLPAGHVTDIPGVTRNEALKLCGNGVVWQQAAAALRYLLSIEVAS